MRFCEITDLSQRDIDFKNGIITIKDSKNNESIVVYITENVKKLLLLLEKRKKIFSFLHLSPFFLLVYFHLHVFLSFFTIRDRSIDYVFT